MDTVVHKRYDPHERVKISFPEQGRTKQSFRDEANINTMLKKYKDTGYQPEPGTRKPLFGDFTQVDFMQAQNDVAEIKSAFESLPSAIRSRFKNSPEMLINFVANPENEAEAVELGLLEAKGAENGSAGIPANPEAPIEAGEPVQGETPSQSPPEG